MGEGGTYFLFFPSVEENGGVKNKRLFFTIVIKRGFFCLIKAEER